MPACEFGPLFFLSSLRALFQLRGAGLPSCSSLVPTSPAGLGFLPEQTNLTCLRAPEGQGTSLCRPFPLLLSCLGSPPRSQAQAVVPLVSPPPLAMSPFPYPRDVPSFCAGVFVGDVGCPSVPRCHASGRCQSPGPGRGRCTTAGAIASPPITQVHGKSLARSAAPRLLPASARAALGRSRHVLGCAEPEESFKLKWKWLAGFGGCFPTKTVFII